MLNTGRKLNEGLKSKSYSTEQKLWELKGTLPEGKAKQNNTEFLNNKEMLKDMKDKARYFSICITGAQKEKKNRGRHERILKEKKIPVLNTQVST